MKPSDLPHEIRYTKGDAVLSAVGATLLIVTEMLGAVFAFAWALSGLLGLGETADLIFMALAGIPGLWLSFLLTKRVLRVEAKLREVNFD
ncbi:hypothetical protein [Oryzibacter oryziterrae]|uniref:hypothetical protein n=1 Tax=Oryzibacter oryziterrae TaxID=2766474 RepID=UPI001F428EEE|nr:hypothetical protein [Oryzibacter oryziterrae]